MTTKKEERELERRMLAVEDPVEMKTEADTEILVPATCEEVADDAANEEEENLVRRRLGDTPAHSMRRKTTIGVRGIGQVSSDS